MTLRDIRQLAGEPDAYAAELRRRWGGLLSYRYIGRSYAAMDLGPVDDTVALRHDMRNTTGGILLAVLGIASPEGGGMSDLEAVLRAARPARSASRPSRSPGPRARSRCAQSCPTRAPRTA